MFAFGHHSTHHSVGRSSNGSLEGWDHGLVFHVPRTATALISLSLASAQDDSYLSKPLSFSSSFFFSFLFVFLSSSVGLSPWNNLLWSTFQPIAQYFFIPRFSAMFPTKASLAQESNSLLVLHPQYGNTPSFHAEKREGVCPFLISVLTPQRSLGPPPRKAEGKFLLCSSQWSI